MSEFAGVSAVIVGAGAFGSAVAFSLAQAGARVTLVDPKPIGDNASGIAAGMIAPALESVLDRETSGHFRLLAAARDLWPGFADRLEFTGLDRCGALLKASPTDLDRMYRELRDEGARVERVGNDLFTPEDWRIDARLTLAAMRQGLIGHGGQVVGVDVTSATATAATLSGGGSLQADIVVLACGYGGRDLAPELGVLTPIKGQLLRFPEVSLEDGPILRSARGYVVPSREGAIAGATMEPGLSDTVLTPSAMERLRVEAICLAPPLALAHANGFAGVRAATPDGLPLLGRSSTGVFLAAGARRNGWLFAPLAADVVLRALRGEAAPEDAAFDPARFIR